VAATIAASPDKTAPSVPAGLTVWAASSSQVNLAWTASTDTGSGATGVKGYNVYRNGIFLKQVLAPATSASDTGLLPSTTNAYTLSAVDNAYNQSARSISASASTPASGTCNYSLSTTSASFAAAGGSATVTVTATGGCGWTAVSGASWITITTGAAGSGNGTVSYSVAANTATSTRSGTMTIAGQSFTVTQAAGSYSISPTSASFPATGGSGSIGVTAPVGASWTASSGSSWITITAGGGGSGNGTVYYSVAASTSTSPLSGTMTIAGQTFTVSQAAAATTPPSVTLMAPTSGSTVGGTITPSASASGSGGVARVEFYRDATNLVGTATATPYTVADDTTKVANGSHSYCAKAYDTAGNSAVSASSTVTVSNATTPPGGQVQWAKAMAGYVVSATGVVADHSGNAVVVGSFRGTMDLGTGPISSTGGSGVPDIFIAKYNPQGGILWVKQLGGAYSDTPCAVAVDSQNNIIVAGSFTATVDFGGGPLTSAGGNDIFVAKYSSSGAYIWAKRFGGAGGDIGNAVAIDGSDNVVLAATLGSPSTDFGGIILTPAGVPDVALVKLSAAAGATLWAKRFGGTDIDQPYAVAVDRWGDVVVTGFFWTAIDMGGGSVSSVGAGAMFMAKYSGVDGSYRWGKVVGGSSGAYGYGIATDPNTGNIVVTGNFAGSCDFGGGAMTTVNSGGLFIAGYDPSGNYLWAKVSGGGTDSGNAVAIDSNGNLVFTGIARYSIDFGTWPQDPWLIGNGAVDYFAAAFTISGNSAPVYRWTKFSGAGTAATGTSTGQAVAFDSLGHVLTAGCFLGTADFGGISATAPASTQAGFVAQYTK
jgi:hypothetical protein